MSRPLLIELGTEELPPKTLKDLHLQFAGNIRQQLSSVQLDFGEVRAFATPRRLAVMVEGLAEAQPEQTSQRRGPAVAAAFDGQGKPTPAATGFAKSCGVALEQLDRLATEKGEWLCFNQVTPGKPATELLVPALLASVRGLRYARGMRWGSSREEFIRPLQWLLLLFGDERIDCELLGIRSSHCTSGHRFLGQRSIPLVRPEDYPRLLQENFVVADFAERRRLIEKALQEAAEPLGGKALIDPELLDEVTALVEWPTVLAGEFERSFLEVPQEALISAMKSHQRYFPLQDDEGRLMPFFLFVSNMSVPDPDVIRRGNERVIRPRLADAGFFFQQDQKTSLSTRARQLGEVIFHRQLGSYLDKTERMGRLLAELTGPLGLDADEAERAARLSKADLLSNMVREFPDLQGLMGFYYAAAEEEPPAVALAIRDQYKPVQSGGDLPESLLGSALALADKLDTLVGMFARGQPPTGSSDPFGLRRAALGIIRIPVEKELDLDLCPLVEKAVSLMPGQAAAGATEEVFRYLQDRLLQYFVGEGGERELALAVFGAASAETELRPLDAFRRMTALADFIQQTEAGSLIEAGRRAGNLLRQAETSAGEVSADLFETAEESALWQAIQTSRAKVAELVSGARYREALMQLCQLSQPVDAFFENVLVMAENAEVRANRLSMLHELRWLFLQVADLSQLGKS